MKMKSFAIFATSSVIAAASLYAMPAMADDEFNGQTSQQNIATDNNNPAEGSDMQNISATSSDTTGSSTDEGTPDTATGDDDY